MLVSSVDEASACPPPSWGRSWGREMVGWAAEGAWGQSPRKAGRQTGQGRPSSFQSCCPGMWSRCGCAVLHPLAHPLSALADQPSQVLRLAHRQPAFLAGPMNVDFRAWGQVELRDWKLRVSGETEVSPRRLVVGQALRRAQALGSGSCSQLSPTVLQKVPGTRPRCLGGLQLPHVHASPTARPC